MAGDKDKDGEGATGTSCDARHASKDLSWERKAEIEEAVVTAISRATTEIMAKFMAMLNECAATSMPVALKTSSGAATL